MFIKKELLNFLIKAKIAGYASGEETQKIINDDLSKTLTFKKGSWKYHDNYFGGEPYGGREVVFFKKKPVYIMTYYGQVSKDVSNIKKVYAVLRNALKLIPKNNPYRGPSKYREGNFLYSNKFTGSIASFWGEETIKENKKRIYKAQYMGGFINQRK